MDYKVGGGSDKGTHTTENCGETQRNQVLRRRLAVTFCPTLHHGTEDNHHGSVVQECRKHCHYGEHPHLNLADSGIALGKQSPEQLLQQSATTYSFADQKQQRHGYHSLVAETFKQLFGIDNADAHEDDRTGKQNESRTHLFLHQCHKEHKDNDGCKYCVS